MRKNIRPAARVLALFLAFVAVPVPPPPGAMARDAGGDTGRESPFPATSLLPVPPGERLYHLRFLRARLDGGAAGSALFSTRETIVPLSEREFWGRADQTEALREALQATEIEPLPGVVVRNGVSAEGGPHRFRTALGEELVDVSFQGDVLEHGWCRISLHAETDRGVELLDASLRVPERGTVALVTPLGSPSEDSLVIGVTPLPQGTEPDLGRIFYAGFEGVSSPVLVSKVAPVYPESARKEKISGRIVLQAVIRTDGVPDGIVVLEMPGRGEWLAGAAVEAISKWRYKPALRDGLPVDAYFTIIVEFILT